ncbi:hypothetical protein [Campylobacter pinnipediorum]|uniref:hypothetical protein n=1 Tax=Campylobacter pinnipediorum TaxID=1965231 RepID=UPI000995AD62|nr:hypothetical protein [Campylobacter pinnipediorum]AQW81257.1 putative membrane protein [Campylobacter pinnipediorum subsp. pinnipediorum]AQW82877.1 putative membrane protein [Campylobacter pinnipediorum subsp. pinnipediorum]
MKSNRKCKHNRNNCFTIIKTEYTDGQPAWIKVYNGFIATLCLVIWIFVFLVGLRVSELDELQGVRYFFGIMVGVLGVFVIAKISDFLQSLGWKIFKRVNDEVK